MLDYDSEDIDGMDDDAGDDQEPAPTGHWKATSSYDIYMVDIPKEQRMMTPPRNSPSASVSGAALNPATARMKIPAPEIITPQTVLKTTHSSKIQHRRTETPALMRERQKKR